MVRNTRTAKISKSAQAPKALEGSEGKPTTAAMRIINKTTLTRNMITPQYKKPTRIIKPETKAKNIGMITAAKIAKVSEEKTAAAIEATKVTRPARNKNPEAIT
ncbi:uncharacterized protein BdWA1_004001 [Babesia duncani]|uniref:Uncharacterized protein n=1 Tax=Babesia duncani TaxID=323732 RepID=A0AAD9UM57_9APIC|nr:hypothetical protein BdWA1_004001 [Babesia duncani]